MADGSGTDLSRAIYVITAPMKWYPIFYLPFILRHGLGNSWMPAASTTLHALSSLVSVDPETAFAAPFGFSPGFPAVAAVSVVLYMCGLGVSPTAALCASVYAVGRPRPFYFMWGASDEPPSRWIAVAAAVVDVICGLTGYRAPVIGALMVGAGVFIYVSEVVASVSRRRASASREGGTSK